MHEKCNTEQMNLKALPPPGALQTMQQDHTVLSGKSGFNTLLPLKAGSGRHFFRQLTKNQCERWPSIGFLEISSLASDTANSIRDQKGKVGKRGTKWARKATKLRPGSGGCVHRHGRGSIYMESKQQAAQQTSPHNTQHTLVQSVGQAAWRVEDPAI